MIDSSTILKATLKTSLETALDIKNQLKNSHSKEETFRTLVALSKTLPRLSQEEKNENNKIKGCESAVWLIIEKSNNQCHFSADSDAKLMRGVLVAILSLVEGKTQQDIQKMNLKTELQALNLSSYLTSSRTNGVLAIINKITSF